MDDDALLSIDGYEDTVIGICSTWDGGSRVERLIYSGEQIVKKMVEGGMTEEEAVEFIDFNIEGGYVGHGTPIVLWPYKEDECLSQ